MAVGTNDLSNEWWWLVVLDDRIIETRVWYDASSTGHRHRIRIFVSRGQINSVSFGRYRVQSCTGDATVADADRTAVM